MLPGTAFPWSPDFPPPGHAGRKAAIRPSGALEVRAGWNGVKTSWRPLASRGTPGALFGRQPAQKVMQQADRLRVGDAIDASLAEMPLEGDYDRFRGRIVESCPFNAVAKAG